jgi:general secretion pathway protein D
MFLNNKPFLLFLFMFCCFSFAAYANEKQPDGPLTFNFNDVDIRTVIRSVAKVTGRNFVIDPKVKGQVTIISSQSMDDQDMYGAFLSALQVNGFAAVEADGVTKIIPDAEAKQQMPGVYTDSVPPKPSDRSVTTIYKLQHIEAEKLVAILRPLISPQSYIAAHSESNTLIIADRAANIDRILKIVKRIDKGGSGELEIVKLEYAGAGDVVGVIEGLWQDVQKKGVQQGRLKLIADERTNSILLSGEESDLLRAKALIAHLDTPVELEGATQVVFLRYAKAKDIVSILRGVDEDKKGKGPKQVNVGEAKVNIQADENTNALIITAPPAEMKTLQSVIRKIDIRRTQVLIEAIIAEVSTSKGAELGVQWRSTDINDTDQKGAIGGTNFGGTAGGGINVLSSPDALTSLGGLSGLNIGYMNGTTTILGKEILNLGALVTALASNGDSNILSTPSLVTLDNEEAKIVVGANVPFATGSYTSTGSTNPENPFTTYERQDVGLKLKVTPQINEGYTIRLDIEHEISSLSSATNDTNIGLQTTKTRSIQTSVMVENGHILVLGGLISDDVQEIVQKVPILGSIPLLGWLFRYTKTTHNKQNLMVFLRPTILRDQNTSSRITFDKYDFMRRRQEEFNEDGIPLMPNEIPPALPEYKDSTEEMKNGQ